MYAFDMYIRFEMGNTRPMHMHAHLKVISCRKYMSVFIIWVRNFQCIISKSLHFIHTDTIELRYQYQEISICYSDHKQIW